MSDKKIENSMSNESENFGILPTEIDTPLSQLKDRIAKATKTGGLTIQKNEKWQDWGTYNSDNFYERLYLDQKQEITDQLVKHNYEVIINFWEKKNQEAQSSDIIRDNYQEALQKAPEKITQAYRSLSTEQKRNKYNEKLYRQKIKKIYPFIKMAISSGKISEAARQTIIEECEKIGLNSEKILSLLDIIQSFNGKMKKEGREKVIEAGIKSGLTSEETSSLLELMDKKGFEENQKTLLPIIQDIPISNGKVTKIARQKIIEECEKIGLISEEMLSFLDIMLEEFNDTNKELSRKKIIEAGEKTGLSSEEISSILELMNKKRFEQAKGRLLPIIQAVLSDGELHPSEKGKVFNLGKEYGLRKSEIEKILENEMQKIPDTKSKPKKIIIGSTILFITFCIIFVIIKFWPDGELKEDIEKETQPNKFTDTLIDGEKSIPSTDNLAVLTFDTQGVIMDVKINGNHTGTTEDEIKLEADTYNIICYKTGYQNYQKTLSLSPGEDKIVSFQPDKKIIPHTGTLDIQIDGGACEIYIKGRKKGLTKYLTQKNLSPGRYLIQIATPPNYKYWHEKYIDVRAGETTKLYFDLKKVTIKTDSNSNPVIDIDGADVGNAPLSLYLPKGKHTFRALGTNYSPITQSINNNTVIIFK